MKETRTTLKQVVAQLVTMQGALAAVLEELPGDSRDVKKKPTTVVGRAISRAAAKSKDANHPHIVL